MALDTIVTGSKLTALANAIRTKGGTSAPLTLDGMAQAVADIPTGGGGNNLLKNRLIGTNIPAYHYTVAATDFITNEEARQANIFELPVAAFAFDQNVEAIEVPAWVTSLNDGTFAGCANLESLTFAGSINQIRSYSSISGFQGGTPITYCGSLTSLSIPLQNNGSVSIYSTPVSYCFNLEKLTLTGTPSQISFNSAGLATYCTSLEEVQICDGLVNLGAAYARALAGCSAMKRLILFNTTVPTLPSTSLFDYTAGGAPASFEGIYVVDALVDEYKAATNWAGYASYIKPISELV